MSIRGCAAHIEASDAVATAPRLLVFASLFPNSAQPTAGLFIRERMFRVGSRLPLVVVSPKPWFPFQGLLGRLKPGYRPATPRREVQQEFELHCPRFLSIPVFARWLDGLSMALCSLPTLYRLKKRFGFEVIDAHFAYPDGYAATLLARWLGIRSTITLRGTEVPIAKTRLRRRLMLKALARADRVFSVAESLKRHVSALGADGGKVRVIGNGVDTDKFQPVSKQDVRAELDLPLDAKVLVSVGGLVPRKGFHRVIACIPALMKSWPDLHYLVVGGASPEGNNLEQLRDQAVELQVSDRVHFLGSLPPEDLKRPLSAADVFVLSTSNEGWANVFLEAMACGLPVVTTDVGGNREVVNDESLGTIVPFDDETALISALDQALGRTWDRDRIIGYARDNSWDTRVEVLVREFEQLSGSGGS